jgi:hypothetical protein
MDNTREQRRRRQQRTVSNGSSEVSIIHHSETESDDDDDDDDAEHNACTAYMMPRHHQLQQQLPAPPAPPAPPQPPPPLLPPPPHHRHRYAHEAAILSRHLVAKPADGVRDGPDADLRYLVRADGDHRVQAEPNAAAQQHDPALTACGIDRAWWCIHAGNNKTQTQRQHALKDSNN